MSIVTSPTLKLRPALGALSLALALAACATVTQPDQSTTHGRTLPSPQILAGATPMQCVPFARGLSGIDIRGDAVTWWDKAEGRYRRTQTPEPGAVIVMRGYADPGRGHVAVVRRVVSDREILVDQANWLNQGEISVNVPVRDVSERGDWSAVRVWHVPLAQWGARTYGVQGFIHP